MSKGNMLLGYARGSVGSMVFSRVKGQQITKVRNPKPANPKTKKQMQQRSSFISPVKFYTHGVQALFKFAFSDKKVTESDFNAFMRNNAKASFPVTKAENDNPGFPALGNYMMTKGKLAEIPVVEFEDEGLQLAILVPYDSSVNTIGGLSDAFVKAGYAEVGDIITLVSISEAVINFSPSALSLAPGQVPVWTLRQFIVDPSSTESIAAALPDVVCVKSGDYIAVSFGWANEPASKRLFSMAAVRSRETALGLEVSTSYLHNGGNIDDYIGYRKQKDQVGKVLADWGATGDAILQGSIAKK